MQKKIILITSNFPYGGASANLLRCFCFCLRDAGHNIEVFLPTGGCYGNKVDQSSVRKGEIKRVKYKRLGFIHHPRNIVGKLLDNLWGLTSPFFFLLHKTVTKGLDVIILYNPTTLSLLNYLLAKMFLQKKIVIIVPEFYEKPHKKASFLAKLKWYNFYFAIKYLYKYADQFIVLSDYLSKYIQPRLNKPKAILIMPNLTDSARFDNRITKPFKPNHTTIGYVGTPTRKDGILDLIKGFSQLIKRHKDLHLLIIGDITNGNSVIPFLRDYARSVGAKAEYVTFYGLTSHQEIPNLLTSCDILALTRPNGVFAEAGFPTKLGEYFATKKPVVITKVGDMATYFKNNDQVVFAEPDNITSIVNAFSFLLENPKEAVQIGLRGYQWMDKNLNYRNQTERIAKFVTNRSKINK